MKLTTLLLLVMLCQVSAISYSQATHLDLKFEKETLENVFSKIEENSEFSIFYKNELIRNSGEITGEFKNALISEILDDVLKSENLSYIVRDRLIMIVPKEKDESGLYSRQQRTVTGKVADKTGAPLPGVSIVVKGTTTGTITDTSGKYSLSNISENSTLQFSFVGMKTQEVKVGNQTAIDVVLVEDILGLEEVVVVGYGTMKKSDLTGSIVSVKSGMINAFPTNNVIQALAGRAAGVQIRQSSGEPGATMQVRIRGTNSIKGSNEPLYVVDGFPGGIVINADIESVEILKDASATAIYGSRGANGVVLITTKQGKAGKTKVEYESTYGVQQISKRLDLMNAEEYARFYNEWAVYKGVSPYFTQNDVDNFGKGTDWMDVVFRKAPIQNHSLSISGGTEKTKFILSGTIFDQAGIMKETDYKRYSIKANINHEISKLFSVDFGVIASRTDNKYNASSSGIVDNIFQAAPTLFPYNDDGSIKRIDVIYSFTAPGIVNPLFYIKERNDRSISNNLMSNVALSFKLTPDIIIRIAGNVINSDSRNDQYVSNKMVGFTPGTASVSTGQSFSLLNENTITYTKIYNNHSIKALAGFTYEDAKYKSLAASGQGFISDVFGTNNLGAASTFGTPSTSYSESALLSWLGRINYSYKERYLFTGTMRADGSSKYSEGNKWGYFPSGAFAWKIKEESFLIDNPTISDLKFRVSWGKTGSQAINAYATQVLLGSGKAVFNDAYYTYIAPGTTYPGDLKWETTEQVDIGLDVGFLNNRFRLTADYYNKKTRDLLNTVTLPSSMGWTSTIKNVGEIGNKGLELALDANILDGSFRWDVSGNMSFNRNKVLKLYGGLDITGSLIGSLIGIDYINLLREGHTFGEFYGYQEDGYNDKGLIAYKDLNNDGSINISDKTFIGDPNPDFNYGLNSTMSFHNFELNIFFQGSYGNDIYNSSNIDYGYEYYQGKNLLRDVLYNHWTQENTDAKYPSIGTTTVKVSDRFVQDGSYLRLRNIQLAYNLQGEKFGLTWLSNLKIYISGQNLLTFTKYSGWDPDVNTYGGSTSVNQGVDLLSYPSAKSVTFGIKVNF